MYKIFLSALSFLFVCDIAMAQTAVSEPDYSIPVKITPYLSGNFGELRPNHFHAGIDFKTQGSVGHSIYSIEDGRVARIVVSPRGYGKALYIEHPNGHTSVYAHLLSFKKEIDEYIKDYQYANETFAVDITIDDDRFPIKKDEIIAKSGNTGSSGGPHLHFEIRDTKSEATLDPLIYYKDKLKDNVAPRIRSINFYPIDGVINGRQNKITSNIIKPENGPEKLNNNITAWGRIALGMKAYDYMTDTSNNYGVKDIKVFVDDSLIVNIVTDTISFDKTRYINSYLDFAEWAANRSYSMRMYRQPGSQLDIYKTLVNDGIIDINEERNYKIRFLLTDDFDNKKNFSFNIKGVKQDIPEKVMNGITVLKYDRDNLFNDEGFSIFIPKGSLYEDLNFSYYKVAGNNYSDTHSVDSRTTPLHSFCKMEIPLTNDTLPDKSKYYLALVNNNSTSFTPAVYENGKMKANVRAFGNYVVLADTVAPVITPLGRENWIKRKRLSFKITDKASGIKSYRGTIDGNFAVFEYDPKTNTIFYNFDAARLEKEQQHSLILNVEDNCNNVKQYSTTFFW